MVRGSRWSGLGRILLAIAAVLSVGEAKAAEPAAAKADPAALEFFEKRVRPVLAERCLSCHGEGKQKAGLRLDSREALLQGGETGPAAVPGKPKESLLVEAVNYGEAVQMPPKTRLAASEVEVLTRWVEIGLPWPSGHGETPAAKRSANRTGFDLKARRDEHWAWKPVTPRSAPEVRDASWPHGRVDRFLLAALEAKGLTPAPDAERRAVLRRLSFDLIGLPPTPAEAEAFLNDRRPDAPERLVDRLLASPRFGERWGRHWLDLVRYAETRGHEFDPEIPNAYQYRDYVVRALNLDVPYDQFLTEHLAGDLLDRPRIDPVTGANESVLGTGFFFLGEEVHSPVDIRADETDRIDNRLDVMSKTFLGLTVACARCHDHKFDAITQRDYYGLAGFLISSTYRQVRFQTAERERRTAHEAQAARDQARPKLLALAARAAKPGVERLAENLIAARDLMAAKPGVPANPQAQLLADEFCCAREQGDHPLHAFVAACDAAGEHVPVSPSAAERAGWPVKGAPGSTAGERLVVDFGALHSFDHLQNGEAFGIRPNRPGDVRLEGDLANPTVGLTTMAAARRDPVFRGIKDGGSERDTGRLGQWERAGQTLRTPEFTIGSGRLWYLARGAGRAYASVNSHLIVNGPLHNAVLTEWADANAGWRWVRHDLSDYKGHRVHVEFSPRGADGLELARVIELPDGREPGPAPFRNATLGRALAALPSHSPEALAHAFQSLFENVARQMESDVLGSSDDPSGAAGLADWMVRHVNLLATAGSEALKAFRDETARLAATEARLAKRLSAPSATAPAILDGNGVEEFVLTRGSSRLPAAPATRRFLEAIAGDAPIGADAATSGRLALARRMLDPSDPFVSRVIVNRVWHHLFGRGIVATVDNFGVLGQPPTNLALLDDLADRFARDGWSIKRLIRELVLSRAYGMSSKPDPRGDAADPENLLWHRMPIRRLEGEPIRDAILAVSNELDGRMYGPSVPVHLTPFMQGRGRPGKSGPLDGDGRRSLYLAIRRNFLAPMMLAFDAPIPFNAFGRRNVTNVPAQALILMNDPFVIAEAGHWADRLLADGKASLDERLSLLYRAAFARVPDEAERGEARAFLESQGQTLGLSGEAWRADRRVWADLAHVLMNSKEFIFLD